MSKTKPTQPPTPTPAGTDLSEGWAVATIGDITVPKVDQSGPGEGREFTYIDIASVDNESKCISAPRVVPTQDAPSRAKQVVRSGDVLVSMTRPNLNAVALVGPELDGAIASTGFDVLRSIHTVPGWLLMVVRGEAFVESMTALVQGALYPAVRPSDVRGFEFPLPPLPEQKRIVAKVEALLERVNAARARLARLPAILKRFRQSVLAAACSGQLTAEWREDTASPEPSDSLLGRLLQMRKANWTSVWGTKYRQPSDPDRSELPEHPDNWTLASMDQLTLAITSGSRAWSKYYDRGTGTFLMAQNVRPGRLDLSFRQAVDPPSDDRDRVRSQVRHGDLLVTIVGANTGDVCPVPKDLPEHYVCQSVALMRPTDVALSGYLNLWLNSPTHGRQQYERYIYGEGRPHLSFDHLRMTPVAIPPLDEQREIVRRVEALFALAEGIEAHVRAATIRAERLPQSILARAFRGELVPTEADLAAKEGRDYEPAERLLARIREESAQRTSQRKKRSRTAAGKKAPMKKIDKASVLEAIAGMPSESFAFDELRAKVPGDYDGLKDVLFALLDDPQSGIVQVFDKQAKAMRFRRRAKA